MDLQLVIPRETKMAAIQFSFSNVDLVPPDARQVSHETCEGHEARKSLRPGAQIIEPTLNVGVADLADSIEQRGFVLVDVIAMRRIGQGVKKGTYYAVRFVFVPSEMATISAEFDGVQERLRSALQLLLSEAMWRVRTYDNPFFVSGVEDPTGRFLSVNLEVRQPLVHPDGLSVMARRKDDDGRPYGDPVPVEPEHHLRVVEYALA